MNHSIRINTDRFVMGIFFTISTTCTDETFELHSASNRIQQHHFAILLQNGVIIDYKNRLFHIRNNNIKLIFPGLK
jgi:hypothetical protein